jgi:hypothetical protein
MRALRRYCALEGLTAGCPDSDTEAENDADLEGTAATGVCSLENSLSFAESFMWAVGNLGFPHFSNQNTLGRRGDCDHC